MGYLNHFKTMRREKYFHYYLMKKFTFLAVFVLFFHHGAPAPVDHFLMVIQWSLAFCVDRQIKASLQCPKGYAKELDKQFYTHGLWPKPESVRTSASFDLQKLPTKATDRSRLVQNWKSAYAALARTESGIIAFSQKFWTHEWDQHGRFQSLDQTVYFTFALDRYDSLSMIHNDIVKTFCHTPNSEVRIPVIIKHIELKFGIIANISCLQYIGGKKMLFEIYFNITLNGAIQNLTDQRNLHRDPCPDNVNVVFTQPLLV